MDENLEKISEDLYTDIDFEDDEQISKAEVDSVIDEIENLIEDKQNKVTVIYSDDNTTLEKKIIEKKTGEIVEITYDLLGQKQTITKKDKDRKIRKFVEYYANGVLKESTEYETDGSYKLLSYNADGSWLTSIVKHSDGTSDVIYFDADKKGTNFIVKLDKNKEVIEKRFER